jgi:cbb3-type cytochrome c oxidase subunit III
MIRKMVLSCFILCGFAAVSALADDGQAVFNGKCAVCHGKDGTGQTKMGAKLGVKNLTDAKVQAGVTDEQLLKMLKEGKKDGDKTQMKAYDTILSAEEMKAVIAYVRTLGKK